MRGLHGQAVLRVDGVVVTVVVGGASVVGWRGGGGGAAGAVVVVVGLVVVVEPGVGDRASGVAPLDGGTVLVEVEGRSVIHVEIGVSAWSRSFTPSR
ncbi:hypothetical protein [Saccharothrix xinjiangensis]|uniref:Uncharacterized protein n=1 Tax=Saccharothrix xinjiangensis TaxID=204798 RepID=A0ABV9XQ32_9PSEU